MEINVLNEIYDAYKGAIEEATSMWKSDYSRSIKEDKQRDIEDEEDLKYFGSLLQKINNDWRPNDAEK